MAKRKKSEGSPAPDAQSRLTAAAVEVIAELGWRSATTRAIAERAGLNLALVNYHFGSKDALLLAALHQTLEVAIGSLDPEALVVDPSGTISAMIEHLDHAPNDPHYRVMFEATMQASADEGVRGVMAEVLAGWRDQLARVISKGRRPTAHARGRATAVAALIDGLFLHLLIDPQVSPRSAIESLQRLLE